MMKGLCKGALRSGSRKSPFSPRHNQNSRLVSDGKRQIKKQPERSGCFDVSEMGWPD